MHNYTNSYFRFIKPFILPLFFLAVQYGNIIAQGYQPVQYGYIAVRQFAAHATCGKPFEFQVHNSGSYPMDGVITVTYDPAKFVLQNAGDFTLVAPGTLTKTVLTGTHQYGDYTCTGNLAAGINTVTFTVNFTGILFGPANITSTVSTPQIITIAGGNISSYFQSAGGPLLTPGVNGQTTTAQFVNVTGNLVIDQSYQFATGSEIMFANQDAGAEIINGSTLKLSSSLAYGCTELWKQIWVRNGLLDAGGNFSAGETVIQDAKNAVIVETTGRFQSFWTRFRKNRYGLLVAPNGGTRRMVEVNLSSTKFFGDGPLLDGSTPLVGASLNDADNIAFPFGFGGPLVLSIAFDGIKYGLVTDNSVATVTGVTFTNIPEIGIYAINNSNVSYDGIFYSSFGLCDSPAHFKNVGIGVKSLQSDLLFRHGGMKNVQTGFLCEPSSIGHQTTIKESCINADVYGIRIFAGNNTAGSIANNKILVPSSTYAFLKGYGVGLFDMGADVSTDVWEITGNTIEVEASAAIKTYAFENAKIYANPKIGNIAQRPVINISGGFHNDVECNPNISGGQDGVVYEESPYGDISCNVIAGNRVALQFFGDCSESKIRGNDITGQFMDLGYGAGFFNYATSGMQIYNRNRFLGNAGSGFEAIHFDPDIDIVNESRYIVSTQGTGGCVNDAEQLPSFSATTIDWFRDLFSPISCAFSCPSTGTGQCAYVPGAYSGDLTPKDGLVRDNLWGANTLAAGAQWNARRYLYSKINSLPGVPAGYQTFLQENAQTSVGQYTNYDAQLRAALSVAPSTLQTIAQLRSQRETLTDNLGALNTWKWENGQFVYDPTTELQRQGLMGSIRQLDTQIDGISVTLAQALASQLGSLKTMNNNAPTTQIFEANQQIVNAYHLNVLEFGAAYTLSAAELEPINAVAVQCPLDGGKAVYQARAIMEEITGQVFDNQDLCGGVQDRNAIEQAIGETVTISPNPASDFIQVDFHGQALTNWCIYDVLGNKIRLQAAESSESIFRIDISQVPSGIYFLSLTNMENQHLVRKVVVSH